MYVSRAYAQNQESKREPERCDDDPRAIAGSCVGMESVRLCILSEI